MIYSKRTWMGVATFIAAQLLATAGQAAMGGSGKSGQVTEAVAPAATVVSTAHYQIRRVLNCNGAGCTAFFPKPGTGRRLNVTRISCYVLGASTFRSGGIGVLRPDYSLVVDQYLSAVYSSPNNVHTLNQAVDVQVAGNQRVFVELLLNGAATAANCTATGTLDTLG